MTNDLIIANADVITADGVVRGAVAISSGRIVEIAEGDRVPAGAIDFGGDCLAPGLVELHTDNVEKHMVPRPGVVWPSPVAAILGHDAQMLAAGVTTVYDAIAVGEYLDRSYRRALLKTVLDAIHEAREAKLFRADHRVHLRCEIADDAVLELFEPYADDPIVGLISLMDHTPGQRCAPHRCGRNRILAMEPGHRTGHPPRVPRTGYHLHCRILRSRRRQHARRSR